MITLSFASPYRLQSIISFIVVNIQAEHCVLLDDIMSTLMQQ